MKTSFRKSELIVIIGTVLAWAITANAFFTSFSPDVQAFLYSTMSLLMPVGFLTWALVKKDYVISGIFGLWSALYIVSLIYPGTSFLVVMNVLPILGSIALIVVMFLRWALKKEEEAKIKAEKATEEAKIKAEETTEEAERKLDKMSNKEIAKNIWLLIKENRSVKILAIVCCILLVALLAVIVFAFSVTPF